MHKIGFHLGNVDHMNSWDWQILELIKPAAVTFLTNDGGQPNGVMPEDIDRILEISPQCHFIMRPYLDPKSLGDPMNPNYSGVLPKWFSEKCKYAMDTWCRNVPLSQKHLSLFNEPNMPRWSGQWEGFGSGFEAGRGSEDIRRFNEWFVNGYRTLKAHNDSWNIGFAPLTPGNGDAWFNGDVVGNYYLHGYQACKSSPTPYDISQSKLSSLCKESLDIADEYHCHVYTLNDHLGSPLAKYDKLWCGKRYDQYSTFYPKTNVPVFIKECYVGYPETPWRPDEDATIKWLEMIHNSPRITAVTFWILGSHYGNMWVRDGKIHPLVYRMAELARKYEGGDDVGIIESIGLRIGQILDSRILRRNPSAALYKYANNVGKGRWYVMSQEYDKQTEPDLAEIKIDDKDVVAQVFGSLDDPTAKIVVYCAVGDWGNIHHVDYS